jgi:hypothetical protein
VGNGQDSRHADSEERSFHFRGVNRLRGRGRWSGRGLRGWGWGRGREGLSTAHPNSLAIVYSLGCGAEVVAALGNAMSFGYIMAGEVLVREGDAVVGSHPWRGNPDRAKSPQESFQENS